MTISDFVSILNQFLPEPQAGLLSGILFGTKATLSNELYDALIKTGTLHIVALSGMNIAILINLVNMLLLNFIGRRMASLLTIFFITGFVWFVGSSPSVVRAAIMGSISLLAVIFGRQTWALLSWLLAVSIMLLLNLSWLTDLSFQLSALATLGIILFAGERGTAQVGPPFAAHPPSFSPLPAPRRVWAALAYLGWKLIRDDLRLTLAAQVFTIPLILFYFHRMSLISPLSNLLIGWVLSPLTALGMLTALLGWLWLPLGQVLAWIAWVPLTYLIKVVEWTSKIPLASVGR